MPQSDTSKYLLQLFQRLYRQLVTPEKALEEVSRILGGTRIYWQKPNTRKRARIERALSLGGDVHSVAERYGVSERYVRRTKKAMELH